MWGPWKLKDKKKRRKLNLPPPQIPLTVTWDILTEMLLLEEQQSAFAETWELRRELKLQYVHAQLPQLKLLGCFRLSVQYPVLAKAC